MNEEPQGLIDLSEYSLKELFALEMDDALAHAIRRVTSDVDKDPGASISAFNSAV